MKRPYLREQGYAVEMRRTAEPNWSRGEIATFSGSRGLKLRYAYVPAAEVEARDTLVIVHGQGECIEKYKELVLDCNRRGFDVYLFDQRGHGASEGDLDIARTTHVEDFSDYVEDLYTFVSEVVPDRHTGELKLFAHSMGGGVATGFLQRHPGHFARAVLHAPMLGINPPIISDRVSRALAGLFGRLPVIRNLRAPGARKIDHEDEFLDLRITHSPERFSCHHNFLREHPEFATDPAGTTFRFGAEAYRFLNVTMNPGAIRKIEIPLLLIQASGDDFVSNEAQDRFCRQARDCRMERITHAEFAPYHELYTEIDDVRSHVLDLAFEFLDGSEKADNT